MYHVYAAKYVPKYLSILHSSKYKYKLRIATLVVKYQSMYTIHCIGTVDGNSVFLCAAYLSILDVVVKYKTIKQNILMVK